MDYRFPLIEKLPPCVFAVINQMKMEARRRGEDIIDSASRGIPNLRVEISRPYARRYQVEIDPETETIATSRCFSWHRVRRTGRGASQVRSGRE